jgi:hypothetical protein
MFEIFLYGRSYLQSRDNCPLNWSFCGDYYGPAGFSMHGPYELSGDKSLLVREYYRIPSEIWKLSTELPFESLKILQIFNGVKVYINFANRIANKQNITKSVSSAAVFVDG